LSRENNDEAKEINSEVNPTELDSQQNMKSDDCAPSDLSAIESLVSNPKISQPCVYEMKEKKGADNSNLV